MLIGFVRDSVRFSAARMDIESAAFLAVQRAGAASTEDGNLIAGFVDGPVAVDSF
jgi:hypothetical protein